MDFSVRGDVALRQDPTVQLFLLLCELSRSRYSVHDGDVHNSRTNNYVRLFTGYLITPILTSRGLGFNQLFLLPTHYRKFLCKCRYVLVSIW